MRFLTKEWYCLMQLWGLGDIFKKISDKEYSDADISKLYEKDSGISTRKQYDEHGIRTSTTLLYHELYNSQTGYEVHLMFWAGDDLAYVTLDCSEISGCDYNVNVRCL